MSEEERRRMEHRLKSLKQTRGELRKKGKDLALKVRISPARAACAAVVQIEQQLSPVPLNAARAAPGLLPA